MATEKDKQGSGWVGWDQWHNLAVMCDKEGGTG